MSATELVIADLGMELKARMCRIRGYIPRRPEYVGVLSFLDDLCRGEPRYADKHPLARYPEAGEAAAVNNAPWHIVRGPLSAVEGHLWARVVPSLPCLSEAVSREKQSNHEEDCATHQMLRRDNDLQALLAVRDALDVQAAETQIKRAAIEVRISELSK